LPPFLDPSIFRTVPDDEGYSATHEEDFEDTPPEANKPFVLHFDDDEDVQDNDGCDADSSSAAKHTNTDQVKFKIERVMSQISGDAGEKQCVTWSVLSNFDHGSLLHCGDGYMRLAPPS
jgi:hypothetical protein